MRDFSLQSSKIRKILNDLFTEKSKLIDVDQPIATFCSLKHQNIHFQIIIINKILTKPTSP
jgi:hypothetical protein